MADEQLREWIATEYLSNHKNGAQWGKGRYGQWDTTEDWTLRVTEQHHEV
jgi:hypothetical protein